MQEFFPSTKNAYIESVKEYGEVLETVVIEDIFMPELLTLLAKNEDAELLSNMFNYFNRTTLIISKKPGNTGISRDIRTEFTTDLLLSD